MKLSDQERHSALWKKLSAYLEDRIQTYRLKNDGDMSELDTARLRGKIAACKEFLAVGEPAPGVVTDEQH